MRPRVFIPQIPTKVDPRNSQLVPKFDTLEDVKTFGDIVVIIDPKLSYAGRKECLDKIVYELRDFRSDDLFLPMGSQYFMMIAAIVISNKVNEIQILEWNARDRTYIKSITDIGSLLLSDNNARRFT